MRLFRTGGALIGAGMLTAACIVADFSSDDPGFSDMPGTFVGEFVAVSDADMAGTAYADGKLELFDERMDEVTLFTGGAARATGYAGNSVISWPQIVDVHGERPRAYVVETRGPVTLLQPDMDSVYEEFPAGSRLTVLDLASGPEMAWQEYRGPLSNPQSVEVSPDNTYLLIANQYGDELVIWPLDERGYPLEPRSIDLDPPHREDDAETGIRVMHISPDGNTMVANVGNLRLQFYTLDKDGAGIPDGVTALGAPIDVGVRLAVGRWTPDSRFFLITDVNSYDSSFAMLTQRGGQVHVVAPPDGGASARLVDSARVGRFAEGLEISDDGTRIASIAMGRTYLPELAFLSNWPKRRTYSLHLLAIDPETGALDVLDEIRAAGVLPEDVIFDETGRNLAVAVFHRRKGEDRKRGFIDFFSITEDDKLEAQGATQPVMRGAHDLARLP